MLLLLILCLLVLGVSTLKVTSSPATSYVLKGWVPNACTLVVCPPHEKGLEGENGDQGFQDTVEAPSIHESQGNGGSAYKRFRRDVNQLELECLRKEIRDIQTQLNAYKAEVNRTLNVLLMPNGVIAGGKIFKTDGSRGDYETAVILCSEMGSMIASPRNATENKAIQQIAHWHNTKVLLGFTDSETEGKFLDANGAEMEYSNWAPGEPNNLGNEDCIEMHPDGKWHDRRCGLAWLLVCQF